MLPPDEIQAALIALIESAQQAPHDFGGEQAQWHIPRLQKAMTTFMTVFPKEAGLALQKARSPFDVAADR